MDALKFISLLLISSIFLFPSCKKEPTKFFPNANFIPLKIEFGEVTFRNESINATEFLWDFGDGNTSTEKDPIHSYQDIGVYNVKLTASNENGSDIFVEVIAIGQVFPDNLTRLDDLPFGGRAEAMNFTFDGKGYVGFGINFNPFEFKKDIWTFDPVDKSWNQVLSDLGYSQTSGVNFMIDDIVYTGLGSNNNNVIADYFYSFDPNNLTFLVDSEVPLMNFNSNSRSIDAIGFSYEGKGYFMGDPTFDNSSERRIWQYTPANSDWEAIGFHPMMAKNGMFHFQLGEKVIIGMGNENANSFFDNSKEVWEYNVATGDWTQKNDFPGGARRDGISFIYEGNGYFGFGIGIDEISGGFVGFSDIWKYDYSADTWEKITDLPVANTFELFGFVLGNSLFFGGGQDINNQAFDSFYEYKF